MFESFQCMMEHFPSNQAWPKAVYKSSTHFSRGNGVDARLANQQLGRASLNNSEAFREIKRGAMGQGRSLFRKLAIDILLSGMSNWNFGGIWSTLDRAWSTTAGASFEGYVFPVRIQILSSQTSADVLSLSLQMSITDIVCCKVLYTECSETSSRPCLCFDLVQKVIPLRHRLI